MDAGPSQSGGTPVANAQAQARVWEGLFEFLARTLGPVPPVDVRTALAEGTATEGAAGR